MLNWQDLPWGFVINKIKIKLKIQSFHLNLVKSNDGKFGFSMIQRRNTKLLFSETCSNLVVMPPVSFSFSHWDPSNKSLSLNHGTKFYCYITSFIWAYIFVLG